MCKSAIELAISGFADAYEELGTTVTTADALLPTDPPDADAAINVLPPEYDAVESNLIAVSPAVA